ncbi:hypothetical protein DE146DRAFT_735384 [Phaeosphaeria sp. MPI-PUGE-AT-0046c]|nr:hypothetical protein DE146DRAFT_735384 [Phaeosphaeria sp. MPI-PUGE-AT-0046c]
MALEAPSQCATCAKPASSKCNGCKINVYGDKGCQALDWAKHKATCKIMQLENKLSRIAVMIHEAYLTFRENTWDTPIKRIEERPDALILHDGEQALKQQHFIDFPHKLINNPQSKMAVLCTLTCNEPLAWMHDLLEGLIKGLPVIIEEVEVGLQRIPRKVTAVHPSGVRQDNWPNHSHFVHRVTHTKSKRQWVLDITGGQFGICTPFWDWDTYNLRFIGASRPIKAYPCGTNKAILHELGKLDGNPALVYGLTGEVAGEMYKTCLEFEKSCALTLPALIELPESKYAAQKKVLLDTITMAICNYKKKYKGEHKAMLQNVRAYEKKFPGLSAVECHNAHQQLLARSIHSTIRMV